MALSGTVLCYGGLRVVQRGAHCPPDGSVLRVVETRPVRPPRVQPVQARTADNIVWRRHWLDELRLVIEFVGITFVEVDVAKGTVVFDRRVPDEMEEHLLFDHVLPLVLAQGGNVVLHGAVVSRGETGAVIIGASGAGKSTLTAFAWQQGWTVGGDDGAVVSGGDPPMVEPTYATIRLSPASAELLDIDVGNTSPVAGKLRVAGVGERGFRQAPVELGVVAIIKPAASGAVAQFQPLSGIDAHAALFGSTFHAELGARFLPMVVESLGSIVDSTTVGRLTVPRGLDGLVAAEALLSAHVDHPRARGTFKPGRLEPGDPTGAGAS